MPRRATNTKAPARTAKLYVAPVPDEGPFRLPALPEWQAPPTAYRRFDPPRPCPRCGAASASFRDLGGAFVCGACGRSFEAALFGAAG